MKPRPKTRTPPVEAGYHKDAVALAKWIHEAVPNANPWKELPTAAKEKYLAVAAKMIFDPPPVIRKAVANASVLI